MLPPPNPNAFPDEFENGMSLRDWFAGQALAGILAANNHRGTPSVDEAYKWADAMLERRAR